MKDLLEQEALRNIFKENALKNLSKRRGFRAFC